MEKKPGDRNRANSENVCLLPGSVEYYQTQLAGMLEMGRYREAAELLRFLLKCAGVGLQSKLDWQLLLDWLEDEFPDAGQLPESDLPDEDLDNKEMERALFQALVQEKLQHDPGYVDRLMESFRHRNAHDKQLLALEQLRYINEPQIDGMLKSWIEQDDLPSLLQFKALQVMKDRGMTGKIRIKRDDVVYPVDLADVPTTMEDYPANLQQMIERTMFVCETRDVNLKWFAEQAWNDFLAYAFGTPLYTRLTADMDESELDTWAAAFHYCLLQTIMGEADEEEIRQLYGIPSGMDKEWASALHVFDRFARAVFIS